MHTQCPHCQTVFRVTAAHLNIAQGHVRCSHCRNVFNATNYLLKQLPQQVASEQLNFNDNPTDFDEDDIPELLREDIYELPQKRSWGSFLVWSIMVILLAAMLAGQAMWVWQRDSILQHSQIRPWLERFCYNFLCALPPTRDVNRFSIQEHIAQVHPEIEHVIQFEATFINNAHFFQPYPELQLTFEDFNGNPLAQRRFKPAEYLPQPTHKPMPANASVHIKLDLSKMDKVIEDGNIVEGYSFEFF